MFLPRYSRKMNSLWRIPCNLRQSAAKGVYRSSLQTSLALSSVRFFSESPKKDAANESGSKPVKSVDDVIDSFPSFTLPPGIDKNEFGKRVEQLILAQSQVLDGKKAKLVELFPSLPSDIVSEIASKNVHMSPTEWQEFQENLAKRTTPEEAKELVKYLRESNFGSGSDQKVFQAPGSFAPNTQDFLKKSQERKTHISSGPSEYARYFAASIALAFLFYYFSKYNEATKKTTTSATQYQTVQKISLGGPFEGLIDMDGNVRSSSDYDGYYRLMYFGFTECPDICPTELRKMIKALKIVRQTHPEFYDMIKPIFISVDTRRDTPEKLKEYSKHFTPNIVWLTGPEDNIRNAAKKYRVHYSIPEDIEEGEDYNVDHSIFFYFMDKKNNFVNFFGQSMNSTQIAESIIDRLNTDHGKMDSQKFPKRQ